jgi:hypothetical protein
MPELTGQAREHSALQRAQTTAIAHLRESRTRLCRSLRDPVHQFKHGTPHVHCPRVSLEAVPT